MAESWTKWEFSSREKYSGFIATLDESDIRKHYTVISNMEQTVDNLESTENLNGTNRDIEEKVWLILDSLEKGENFNQNDLSGESDKSLRDIFSEVQKRLNEVGFINFCQSVSELNDDRMLNISFECVILKKLNEEGEISLPAIHAIANLAKNKPNNLARCIIQCITSESSNFEDLELMEKVFTTLDDSHRDEIVKAFVGMVNFQEKSLPSLHVMCQNITNKSFHEVIQFMIKKCEEFADSPHFGRLLVTICSNSQSVIYNDSLLSVIDKHRTLFKKKAMMNLSLS